MDILILEGNTAEIILDTQKHGMLTASQCYETALALHTPNANFETYAPYAPELHMHSKPLESYDAYALTGSGVSWSSIDAEAKPYLDKLEIILRTGKPVIGSCWGMQCGVTVFGGKSEPNLVGTEIGLADHITLTDQGRVHWLFAGMPDRFSSPCIHRDHVTDLPDCFDLAGNAVSPVQAVAHNGDDVDFCGVQYHPEFTLEYVREIVVARDIEIDTPDMIASFPDTMSEEVSNAKLRTRVFGNWISHVRETLAAGPVAAQ